MTSQQEKRDALAARVTSQAVQLQALDMSIGKLRHQEEKARHGRPGSDGHSPTNETAASIHLTTELKHASTHIHNAIEHLDALASLLRDGSVYDE
ncbi:hypothetical protein BPY_22970 [Bifidobacterium psychraerophilum]|uniref:hypothetical protein n=1 Tax=Bifidobacterium psychraerophilum TaxID=218140 RepID=UPI0031115EBC